MVASGDKVPLGFRWLSAMSWEHTQCVGGCTVHTIQTSVLAEVDLSASSPGRFNPGIYYVEGGWGCGIKKRSCFDGEPTPVVWLVLTQFIDWAKPYFRFFFSGGTLEPQKSWDNLTTSRELNSGYVNARKGHWIFAWGFLYTYLRDELNFIHI